MWNNNAIAEKLQIDYPIIQAGMAGGTTTPELVAAVSNAGGLGTLGAGYMNEKQTREAIQEIKSLTRHPFAVNLFIPEVPNISTEEVELANDLLRPFRHALELPEPEVNVPSHELFEEQLNVLIQEQVPVCSFTFGVPSKDTVHALKAAGMTVIGTGTTVKEALINEEHNVDMVVMQGSEAGGHRGTFSDSFDHGMIGTMSLIPQTVDAVNIPVIAAGGIMDGRGVLAALTLGAEAVQMGTAFVTTLESGARKQHIDSILNSTEDQTVVTSVFSGKPARGIHNDFITSMTPYESSLPSYPILNSLTTAIRKESANSGRPEWMHLWSGQSPRLSRKEHAKDLITSLVKQIEDLLNKNR